ncbi:MAG: helix-turn-helix domain-containing protein [Erysipelothrix sp.]|nr:helix-turn-helix domain-containing protein [Erysipelothrix sp.]
MDIGNRLKDLRLKNDLTLEELASRSELTKGFLSQVERDLTSPSVSTLSDILEALGISFTDFFKLEKPVQKVFKEEDFFVDEQNDYTINWIVPNSQKNMMEPIIIEINPQSSSMEIEPFDGEEFGYVLKGEIELVFKDEVKKVKTGETFYLLGDEVHTLLNRKNTVAKVMWVVNPPIF